MRDSTVELELNTGSRVRPVGTGGFRYSRSPSEFLTIVVLSASAAVTVAEAPRWARSHRSNLGSWVLMARTR